jgi:hypothetical protein
MKVHKKMFMFALVALALVCGSSIAQANLISGELWHVPEAIAQNAIPGNVPGTTPFVTFDVNSPFTFDNRPILPGNQSVGGWLGTGSAFNIVENIAGTLASSMDNGTGTTGTIVDFKGTVTVTNGQTFTVTHDDGLTLIIGGLTVVSAPGPTSPTLTTVTYTGPSGNLPFELVYGESNGPPAVLQTSLPLSSVPLPPSALLLGSGLLGLVGLRRFGKG